MPFDRESGQIYDESFTLIPKKDEDDLIYVDEPGHARKMPQNRASVRGTCTLRRMAMLKILRSLDLLYPGLLKAYPIPILEQVWKAINNNGLAGLRMWKLFSTTGIDQVKDRRLAKRPQCIFSQAIAQGSSIEFDWLTNLTLDKISLSMSDYVHVSSMSNLASLVVIAAPGQDTDFSDRVLRAWNSDATTGCFRRLRHMFVSGHRYITAQSLAHLSCFEVLELFCAHNCRFATYPRAGVKRAFDCEDWHDPPNGKFRTFLNAKSNDFDRRNEEAPFPSSFHAFVARHKRPQDTSARQIPHLHMNLHSGILQKRNAIHGWYETLHCFERRKSVDSHTQDANQTSIEPKSKRHKLKHGKARALCDMLAGLT